MTDTGLECKYDPQNGIAQVVRSEMKGVAIIFQDDHVIHQGLAYRRLLSLQG